ncbi:MAG: endonuclease/exonuclease/phosphatase family protein [Saprospiraceae bacterium]
MLKSFFRFVGALLVVFFLYIAVVLIHGTFYDYQPAAILSADATTTASEEVIADSTLSLLTWNLGFGGLGAKSNFFYDHGDFFFAKGRMVRSPENLVNTYNEGIEQVLSQTKADFFLLQEVDFESRRSYYNNQFEKIKAIKTDYAAAFAPNYKVPRVPVPVFEPWRAYGYTHSGLASYSRFQPTESTRYQLPGDHPWPTRVFQLDRCVLWQRYALANGKELLIGNVHNSAYDQGGVLKKQQMDFLKDMVTAAYEKGNYVILGGDWNQVPPYFQFDGFMPGKSGGFSQINIAPDFLPAEWQWVYDPTVPTNRKMADVYEPGETFITLIDFYLLSPNLRALSVKGINQNFAYSDHQPVYLEVALK